MGLTLAKGGNPESFYFLMGFGLIGMLWYGGLMMLIHGAIGIGQHIIRRQDSPAAYWGVLALYVGFMVFVTGLAVDLTLAQWSG